MSFVFDGHSDMWCNITMRRLAGERNVFKKYHLPHLQEGNVGALIAAVWIETQYTDDPTARMLEILGAAAAELRENKEVLGLVLSGNDVERIRAVGKTAILFGMEGLSGLKGRAIFLEALYRMGVRHCMLTWNEENEFAAGVGDELGVTGLKQAGVEAVKLMEELGMIVDVSHASEKTFWDIEKIATKPLMASHSNAYAVCPAKRNLKDEQIKAVAASKGIIGMNAWPTFVSESKQPTVEDLADHVDYIAGLVGIDCVACGFDFCDYLEGRIPFFASAAGSFTKGLFHAGEVPNFFDVLRKRGYSQEDLDKIAYKNAIRYLRQVL